MEQTKTQAAVSAILDEYKKAITALQNVIDTIDSSTLTIVADPSTTDTNCSSIQTILAHVVNSGYGYAVYIRKHKKMQGERPEKMLRPSSAEYKADLDDMFQFTCDTFQNIYDDEMEVQDNTKKITTGWAQQYDIEQLMEHAIVHILRHRRQIENFITIINQGN